MTRRAFARLTHLTPAEIDRYTGPQQVQIRILRDKWSIVDGLLRLIAALSKTLWILVNRVTHRTRSDIGIPQGNSVDYSPGSATKEYSLLLQYVSRYWRQPNAACASLPARFRRLWASAVAAPERQRPD
jgi:hypothetical protein